MAEEEKDREAKEVKVEDGEPGPDDERGWSSRSSGGEEREREKRAEGERERGSYLGHRLGRSKIRGCSAPPPHAWLANRLPSSAREYSDAGGVFTRTKPGLRKKKRNI